jgi:Tol biopolymer transport system component
MNHARTLLLPAFLALLLLVSCGDFVREDRTIEWSKDGETVAFQHGKDGVYVASRDGEGLERIHEADPHVLATSRPVWSPDGERLLFTTAEPLAGAASAAGGPPSALVPEGRLVPDRPVSYTCWLREGDGEPRVLFRVARASLGLVAAGRAVGWSPDGERVLHVVTGESGLAGLHELDLASGETRRAFPHGAERLVFDVSPDGEHVACVLGTRSKVGDRDGIWIGRHGDEAWWRVPGSWNLPLGGSSLLERLRAARPAWTPDGARFAFSTRDPVSEEHRLLEATLEGRELRELDRGEEPHRDLHWSPDGRRLGFVSGPEWGDLRVLEPDGRIDLVDERPVRRFAGWNAAGDKIAYVMPMLATDSEPAWSLLLLPVPGARDVVAIGRGAVPPATCSRGCA